MVRNRAVQVPTAPLPSRRLQFLRAIRMVADALLWYLVRRTRDSADSEGSAEDNGSLLLQPLEIRRDAVWSVFLMELTATISVWISVHRTILHREKPIKSKFGYLCDS